MASITRTQTFQRDDANMLAVQGKGTVTFQASGAPSEKVSTIGAVFTGNLRVTRLASGRGYNFLLTDVKRGTDRRRVFFQGDAEVRIGNRVVTVAAYYNMLAVCERLGL